MLFARAKFLDNNNEYKEYVTPQTKALRVEDDSDAPTVHKRVGISALFALSAEELE